MSLPRAASPSCRDEARIVSARPAYRAVVLGVAIAGIGATSAGCTQHHDELSINAVPLARHVHVAGQARGCPATPELCYRWAIFEGEQGTAASQLKRRERRALVAHGWKLRRGTSKAAVAADSGDGKWFVSLETGPEQLSEARQGKSSWGDRQMVQHLRALIADNRPTLAVTLERGRS
jgi:hypothetical protein